MVSGLARSASVAGACVVSAALVLALPTTVKGTNSPRTPASLSEPSPSPSHDSVPSSVASSAAPSTSATPGHDNTAPSPVTELHLGGNDLESFTVTWHAATDDVGVVGYIVMLNGQFAARTPSLGANFRWFGTDEKVLVQVAAVDAAGNRSEWRSLYIVPPPVQTTRDVTSSTDNVAAPPLDDPAPATNGPVTRPGTSTTPVTHPSATTDSPGTTPPSASTSSSAPAPTNSPTSSSTSSTTPPSSPAPTAPSSSSAPTSPTSPASDPSTVAPTSSPTDTTTPTPDPTETATPAPSPSPTVTSPAPTYPGLATDPSASPTPVEVATLVPLASPSATPSSTPLP